MVCPRCGKSNDATASFCAGCGSQLAGDEQARAAAPDPQAQSGTGVVDEPDALYRAVTGPVNQGYYLDRFRRFERDGKAGASWHWPAFFVTFFWLLYRKMWLVAGSYFGLAWLLLIVLVIGGGVVGGGLGMVLGHLVHLAVVLVLPALYANALYYRHCRRQIEATDALAANPQARLQELSRKGGTSAWALVIAVVLGFFLFLLGAMIIAAIALPAYQDYVTRARVAEATILGATATTSVEGFYYRNQRAPHSLEEAGMSEPLPPSIRSMEVDGASGTVAITFDVTPLEGRSLLLAPTLGEDGLITWGCTSQDIDNRHLPSHCRQPQ